MSASKLRQLTPLALLGAALLLVPVGALANEQSVLLTNKGVMALDEGKPEAALSHFRDAVKADPADEDARYYLAHTYLQTGDPEAALKILGDRTFRYWDADYLRGLAQLNMGRKDAARTSFRRATTGEAANPRAYYYLGVVEYQQNNLDAAQQSLAEAGELEPDLEPYRQFYMGLIAQAEGDDSGATRYFEKVRVKYGDSPAAAMAEEMLTTGRAPEAATAPAKDSPFFWDVRGIVQYDTNPGLVQSDSSLARIYHEDLTDATEAFRLGLNTDLGLRFGDKTGFGIGFGVGGYGAVHLNNSAAEKFNVFQARANLKPRYHWDKWGLALPVFYTKTWLSNDFNPYSDILGVGLAYHRVLTKQWLLRTSLLFEAQDYGDATERNGLDIALPVDAVYLPHEDVRLLMGYAFNFFGTEEDNSPWAFSGHRIQAGATYSPMSLVSLYGRVYYYYRGYENDFLDASGGRVERTDNEVGLGTGVRILPNDFVDISVGYDGTFQNSVEIFTYDRHVATVSVGFRF